VCATENKTTVLTIDNRRHRQDDAIAVVDDRVHGLVFNNVKIMPQVTVCLYEPRQQHWVSTAQKHKLLFGPACSQSAAHLVETHELRCSVLFGLVERLEVDVIGRFGCVGERATDGVQVMGPNGHQAPLPAQTQLIPGSMTLNVSDAYKHFIEMKEADPTEWIQRWTLKMHMF